MTKLNKNFYLHTKNKILDDIKKLQKMPQNQTITNKINYLYYVLNETNEILKTFEKKEPKQLFII